MSRPLHSTPQRLKAEKGLPLQRGGLLFLNPTTIAKLKQRGKRRGKMSRLGKRRRQRGGRISSEVPPPPGYDMVRYLRRRYKRGHKRK